MANRNTLHINKLEVFKEWLIKEGWEIESTKGMFEVLRARNKVRKRPLIVYRSFNGKEHFSVDDRDMGVVRAFIRSNYG